PLVDTQHIMLRDQKNAGCFVLNQALYLGIRGQAFLFVECRAPGVDQVIEPWYTCIPLTNPAACFCMVQGMENSIRVKCRVVSPGSVKTIGRLAFPLEKLVPGRTWLPDLEIRAQPYLAEHFGDGLGDLAEEHL